MPPLKLIVKKEKHVLTISAKVIIFLLFVGALIFISLNVHSYLALNKPVNSEVLVVEGWIPDYALASAADEFKNGGYKLIVSTGTPLSKGYLLSKYESEADLGAELLKKFGIKEKFIAVVPSPLVNNERTKASALAFKEWIHQTKQKFTNFNLYTLGVHSRRSRNIYQDLLGKKYRVGILSDVDLSYDSNAWWNSSRGVKIVLGEMLSYLYYQIF